MASGFDGTYPAAPGNKRWSIYNLPVNGVYVPITAGVAGSSTGPTAGGFTVTPQQFGLKSFDFIWVMGSNDGIYNGNVAMKPYVSNRGSAAAVIQLIVAVTGAEQAAAQPAIAAGTVLRLMACGN